MGGKRSPLDAHKDWLLELIAGEPDLTRKRPRARAARNQQLVIPA
jgi:hypothetical protein